MHAAATIHLIRHGFLVLICLMLAGGVEGSAGLCLQSHRHAGEAETHGHEHVTAAVYCSCEPESGQQQEECQNVSVVAETGSSKAVILNAGTTVTSFDLVDVQMQGVSTSAILSNPVLPSLRTVILLT